MEFIDMLQHDGENLVDFEEDEEAKWMPSREEENLEKAFEAL